MCPIRGGSESCFCLAPWSGVNSTQSRRKTAWTLLAVEHRGTVVNIDSQIPNRLAADFVRSGGLGPVPDLVKPEQTFGDSRLDLYYEAGPVRGFAEVKGVTLNGATLGLVLCMLACGVAGSHPGNVWPIMVGYVVMSFLAKWLFVGESYTLAINAQAIPHGPVLCQRPESHLRQVRLGRRYCGRYAPLHPGDLRPGSPRRLPAL